MPDSYTFLEKLFSGLILALGGGVGYQQYRFNRIDKARDEHSKQITELRREMRDKTECGNICMNFQKTMERMTDKVETGFHDIQTEMKKDVQRLYDKIDGKEDKHP